MTDWGPAPGDLEAAMSESARHIREAEAKRAEAFEHLAGLIEAEDLEGAERELAARVEDRASPDADPDRAALLEALRTGEDRQALRIVRRIRAASVPALEPLGRQLGRSRSRSPARLRTSLRRCSPGSAG